MLQSSSFYSQGGTLKDKDTTIHSHATYKHYGMSYNNGKHTYDLFDSYVTLFAYLTLKNKSTIVHAPNYSARHVFYT